MGICPAEFEGVRGKHWGQFLDFGLQDRNDDID